MRLATVVFLVLLLLPAVAVAGPLEDGSFTYVKPTIENLSKLYWALGMLDLKDDNAIEQYLFITECDHKYLHNTLEWNTILQDARKTLGESIEKFPTHFEIMRTLSVGGYDDETHRFELEPDSVMNNVEKLSVSPNIGEPICGSHEDMKSYPRSIVLVLDRPFTFKAIPARPQSAIPYIHETHKDHEQRYGLGDSLVLHEYKRYAYMRLKIKLVKYLETVDFKGHWGAVVSGSVEGIEVYADRGKQKLLYTDGNPPAKAETK